MNYSAQELLKAYEIKKSISLQFKQNKKFGQDLFIDDFINLAKFLNSQKYGLVVQKYIANLFKFKEIPSKNNAGDFVDWQGNYIEFKVSFLNCINDKINLVQIRQWQPIAQYYCLAIDLNNEIPEYKLFILTQEQMKYELSIIGSNCHMTHKENAENINNEKRISIKYDVTDRHYQRWIQNYLSDIDLKSLSKSCNISM